jgi:hypothetical protein
VSLSSVPKQAGECVKKTVTPGVEVQKYLYKPLPLSRDMKQKNVISVVACLHLTQIKLPLNKHLFEVTADLREVQKWPQPNYGMFRRNI